MIALKDIQNIYFIGIGGIGMSAIARYFNNVGVKVSGYDKTATALSQALQAEGMNIHYTDDTSLLDKDAQLVVYTPAVPKNHTELNWYRDNGYEVVKRSDVLQIITKDSFNICVAGTHGKTSISTMTGHILRHTGYGCNAFLGGLSVNYESNFWASKNNVCVVEADEYDRSFHKLTPDIAIITSMDADHLDIYGTVEALQDAFVEFAEKIKPNGLLIRKQSLIKLNESGVRKQLTYQLKNEEHTTEECTDVDHHHEHDIDIPDVYASNIRLQAGSYLFDANISGVSVNDITLNIGGLHNIENVLAAITVAIALQIDVEKIKAAVADFKGVKRRFEYVVKELSEKKEDIVFIDDYAHHPAELKALIGSAQNLFPELKCTLIFQPHLFSRTKDFAEGFASSLDMADEVILLPIYPARELPMEGVTSELIKLKMKNKNVEILTKDEIVTKFNNRTKGLIITAGAGDIDTIVPLIKQNLES
jgi:UDP-N-acetylmuramate--alanine ligase